MSEATKRYAVVTGANKGIGFEICKQLASQGVTVLLTARNENRGTEALQKLKEIGLSDFVNFHPLDVTSSASVASLAEAVKSEYGRLDILVNNAGVSGIRLEGDPLLMEELIENDVAPLFSLKGVERKAIGRIMESYEDGEECLMTNYYGAKRVTEALIPLLQLSDSPRIVNVSSLLGNIQLVQNEWAKAVLSNENSLTEERVDEVVQEFLKNLRESSSEANQWPTQFAAYKISKAALNAYSRIISNKYPNFCINCICPGLAQTDITFNVGRLTAAEAAQGPVKLALLPHGGPSGSFFYRNNLFVF